MAASIDRSLTLAAQLQFSALADNQALFAYDIDLSRLDAAVNSAVEDALHGRLTAIDAQAASGNGAIRLVTSAASHLRERKTSWRINLLGILNVASFVELVREGSVTFDPVSGALTAAEKVSSRRIRVKSHPLESDPEKLRQVLFESLMVTAAYQASRALTGTVSLKAEQVYLEQRSRTKRHDLEDHYRALIALGLCDEPERDARLGSDLEFGTSTFVIENRFDEAACDAMFLAGGRQPAPDGALRADRAAGAPRAAPGRRSNPFVPPPARSRPTPMWAQVRDPRRGHRSGPARPHPPRLAASQRGQGRRVHGGLVGAGDGARRNRAGGDARVPGPSRRRGARGRSGIRQGAQQALRGARRRRRHHRVRASTIPGMCSRWMPRRRGSARLESTIISTRFAARYAETEALPADAVAAAVRAFAGGAGPRGDRGPRRPRATGPRRSVRSSAATS